MILSHHGEYEFGSPKRPKTLEALLLHQLDDLDAKMNGFMAWIEKEKDAPSRWTSYHKLFDRFIYKPGEEGWTFCHRGHRDHRVGVKKFKREKIKGASFHSLFEFSPLNLMFSGAKW